MISTFIKLFWEANTQIFLFSGHINLYYYYLTQAEVQTTSGQRAGQAHAKRIPTQAQSQHRDENSAMVQRLLEQTVAKPAFRGRPIWVKAGFDQ